MIKFVCESHIQSLLWSDDAIGNLPYQLDGRIEPFHDFDGYGELVFDSGELA